MKTFTPLRAPEREGDALKGGGHPADKPVPEQVEIDEMTGHPVGGHGKVPGIGDRGKPGSQPDIQQEPQRDSGS